MLVHGAGLIEHENQGGAGQPQFLRRVELHRQDLLDVGAVPAARSEALLAADHDESAAEVVYVPAQEGLLEAAELEGRDVVEDDQVVSLQRQQVLTECLGRADLHGDVRLPKRPGQRVQCLDAVSIEHEHRAATRRGRERLGAVVDGQRVGARVIRLERRLEPVNGRLAEDHLGELHRPSCRDVDFSRRTCRRAVDVDGLPFAAQVQCAADRGRGLQHDTNRDRLAGPCRRR